MAAAISPALMAQQSPGPAVVLHAAHLLQIDSGRVLTPGEILIEGERITAAGSFVPHPAAARLIDLGDTTPVCGLDHAFIGTAAYFRSNHTATDAP